ncbi:MAG: histidinol dehydrogenase [Pirellulaceae bacterium]|nr:MAG: histidinol dehydrogenase [Pirellulaceae bacterium]
MEFHIRRIDGQTEQGLEKLEELRARLSLQGDIVSPRSAEKTRAVFGEPLTPQQVVERICRDVQREGVSAVCRYTKLLDGVELSADTLRVPAEELQRAHRDADPQWLETVRHVRANIEAFQRSILHRDTQVTPRPGVVLTQRYRPIERVGITIPGGAAAYPSTILMTAVPAQVAQVPDIALVLPPTPYGASHPQVLAVCAELGLDTVYRIGGAQAIAALAYGVQGLAKVDKIVGPGNLFVTLAKKWVYGQVDIDALAGPSEIVVVADEQAQPQFLAADMLAQAEHAPGAAILITPSSRLLDAVEKELHEQCARLERAEWIVESLEQFGALVSARDLQHACELTNWLAPEHVQVQTRDPEKIAANIVSAGAIFLGPYSPVALGDYAAGPSHVLPTSGTARWASGLSANSFVRSTSIIHYTREALAADRQAIETMASVEGLTAHRASISVRFQDQ